MTEIGIVGGSPVVSASGAGTLAPISGDIEVDWWVGADDRWHHASTESAVRQRIAVDGHTVETRLRVPGGDVVQRLAAVPDHGAGVVLMELENDSPVPLAVAVVLRAGEGAASVEVADAEVRVGGRPVLHASRSIARTLIAASVADARSRVDAGSAVPPSEGVWPQVGSVVVVIFPLPHTRSISVAIGGPESQELSAPADLPPIAAVAHGWDLHLGRAAEVSVPDQRLLATVAAARRHLLIGSGQPVDSPYWNHQSPPWAPAVGAVALDKWGHELESRELLLAASGVDDLTVHARRTVSEAGALLWAWAERLERRPDPELEVALTPWIEQVAIGLMRRPRRFGPKEARPGDAAWRAVGLAAAGSLLSRLTEHAVGPDIVDALPALIGDLDTAAPALALSLGGARLGANAEPIGPLLAHAFGLGEGPDPVSTMVESASTAGALAWNGRSQHPALSALFLTVVGRALVSEPAGAGGPVVLLSQPQTAWLGSAIEVHGMPVAGGAASFGVRWHGERPALLWDVTGPSHRMVRAPGLEGSWAADRARGEALLGPTPGLAAAAGPESPDVRRGESLRIDDDPDSFA